MYLPESYKPYKKRACLLRTDGVKGYLRFPAQISIGFNVNLRADFQQDALPQFPWLPFVFVDINDLRMRINLQHRGCFPLAAIGVKNVYWMFGAPLCTRYSIDRIPDCAGMLVWISSTKVLNFSLIGWKLDELLGVKFQAFHTKKGKRKVQGVPQSQTTALPRPQEE